VGESLIALIILELVEILICGASQW